MHKMEVHLDYTSKRIDTQCEKLANRDNRLKAVEDDIQKHKGELTMLKWIQSGIGVVAGGGGSDHYDSERWLKKR